MHARRRLRAALLTVAATLVLSVGLATRSAAPAGAATPSRCTSSGSYLSCTRNTTTLWIGIEPRQVHWQTPLGTPPAGGWPTVLMFQGSLFSGDLNWSAYSWLPFGAYHQTQVVQRLLDNGYAVITPEAHLNGATFWDTNNPLFSLNWSIAPDHFLMQQIFSRIDTGQFGALNGQKLFATGISSGGYMASRMALAYPSRFKAIAIQSGSYAPCAGPLCVVPYTLPATHAPTLHLHGVIDPVVPIATMWPYNSALKRSGVATKVVTETFAGHRWIAAAPAEVLAWFNRYR